MKTYENSSEKRLEKHNETRLDFGFEGGFRFTAKVFIRNLIIKEIQVSQKILKSFINEFRFHLTYENNSINIRTRGHLHRKSHLTEPNS